MASHPDLDLLHPPPRDDGAALAAPHMAFHGDPPLPFPGPRPRPRPRPSDRFFSDDFRCRGWNREAPNGSPPGGDDDAEEVDDDEDDDDGDEVGDDGDGEVEGLVVGVDLGDKALPSGSCDNGGSNNNNTNNSSGSVQSGSEKVVGEPGLDLQKDHHSFGSNRNLEKDSNVVFSCSSIRRVHHEQQQQQVSSSNYDNAISISSQDMYYSQMMQNSDGPSLARKEVGGENGCGFSGRKDVAFFVELGESLKAILSDPITGILMDDAMILPCGHSFGNGGIQHILKIKSCYTCGQSIKEELVAPNLALRTAVQAFRMDEELQSSFRSGKRRKDRCDQENGSFGDSYPVDYSRGKGVQFPFVVTDRVIIKGNKRTPQRFVGREAVVTTQCLNGWYVVKTLDNAESVKLQYRSLAKVPDNPSANGFPNKAISSNWL